MTNGEDYGGAAPMRGPLPVVTPTFVSGPTRSYLVGAQQEDREQPALSVPADFDDALAIADLHRAEDPELQLRNRPPRAASVLKRTSAFSRSYRRGGG
jgi:hypothetical protein